MFYSQFILAKKGPLGTIWIAAHLERKLRKNQVADTDIGVSVDSILFPEAPIALRLSSHLLLGVVRIYSRKVNYLFHDCSEALLKIKQAFRSTAVDLPPEESTAPYHSITLPETFHLDDFELPDSAFLHGNSVDHHVSTREQITLQDNTDGLGYLTSQFGSDERFGDGDTSQFGLDLDEDVFLDKVTSSQHASVSFDTEYAVSHDQPIATFSDMDIGQGQFMDRGIDAKMNLGIGDIEINENPSGDHGYNIQTPDLNEVFFRKDQIEGQSPTSGHISSAFPVDDIPSPQLIECAQTPPSPILLEGSISAHTQEIPLLIPHEKNSPSSIVDAIKPETEGILHPECDCPGTTNNNLDALAISPESTDIVMPISTSTALEPISLQSQRVTAAADDHNFGGEQSVDGFQNELMPTKADVFPMLDEIDNNGEVALSVDCSPGAKNSMTPVDAPLPDPNALNDVNDRDPITSILQPCSSKLGESNIVFAEGRISSEDIVSLSCKDVDQTSEAPARDGVVHPTGSSVDVPGEDSCVADVLEPMVRVHQTSDSVLSENMTSAKKQKELTPLVSAKDNQLDQLNCTSSSEFPEPAKMLSAPNGNTDLPNDLGQLTSEKGVTESDESVDRNKSLSGKKHHLTGSMSALQSGTSAKSAGRPRLRRNREHIPDDDDLLASILVGRTPNFKSQPTPPHKINSVKRPRLNPKVSLLKRKVLFDDTMVLHADAIRQQLINTEDIRRIRKKAPCTRSEIWMVQSSSEELEIFEEPIFTGISAELHSLHARTYTSCGNPALLSDSKSVGETYSENVGEQVVVLVDNVDGEIQVPSNISILTEPSSCKDAGDCDAQERVVSQPDQPQQEPLGNTLNCTLEIDGRVAADASYVKSDDACVRTREQSVLESNEPQEMNDDTTVMNKSVPSDNFTSMEDADGDRVHDITIAAVNDDPAVLAGLDNGVTPHRIDSCSQDKDGTCLQADTCVLPVDENLSVPGVMMEFVEPNLATIYGQQEVEQNKEDYLEVGLGDKAFQEQFFLNEKHPSAMGIQEEMMEKASSSPLHTGDETENILSTVGENSGFRVLNTEGVMDDESTLMDFSTVIESSDFCSAIHGNTEFLNADDEEDHCEADNDIQNPEEAQSLENSGWSSRTRGVARYLKSLFDDEYGHGRKVVAMDHLIAGKTRKEASRMFFETLVLKTKDYIQVEQAHPCDIINIKPQTKLLKSEF